MKKKPKVVVSQARSKPIDLTEVTRDRYEKRMRKVLKVGDHLKYNRDLNFGEIGAWILLSIKGLEAAVKLLIDKACTIYVHQPYASAKFSWNYYDQEFQCELWKNQKSVEKVTSGSIKEVKVQMHKYWQFCKYRKPLT